MYTIPISSSLIRKYTHPVSSYIDLDFSNLDIEISLKNLNEKYFNYWISRAVDEEEHIALYLGLKSLLSSEDGIDGSFIDNHEMGWSNHEIGLFLKAFLSFLEPEIVVPDGFDIGIVKVVDVPLDSWRTYWKVLDLQEYILRIPRIRCCTL